ncbi:hypothetical protein SBI_02435 [Streptomyces bingchenggensis BCW-1]|uniref:Uncharacterized protein n=1 Tax=Streptomyces bingchenggensis (strain BCW-1) TaxID=749414 RepID=D7BX11_STRBB|nr:hypothetical protein SBI_02435 [Streptomyces bingchenggensis BCW-1]
MGIEVQAYAVLVPFFGVLTVLLAVALSHPDPATRARAERIFLSLFGGGGAT